jgi:uncharacterized membrane protein
MSYFEILLLIHIVGAIIGFGPSYTFAVLGPLAGRLGGPESLGLLKGMVAIERRLILPFAALIQPLTGVLLIFESGRNHNFFGQEWLWIAILLYIATFYAAVLVQTPNVEKVVTLIESGNAGGEEFERLLKRIQRLGPFITVSLTIIVFLMITKPGAPDSFF